MPDAHSAAMLKFVQYWNRLIEMDKTHLNGWLNVAGRGTGSV